MGFTAYQTTVAGWLIRTVTRRKLLQYPDEIALPQSEMDRYKEKPQPPPRNERTDSRASEETRVAEGGAANGGDKSEKGKDLNLVDWYSEDDPENPKNVRSSLSFYVNGTKQSVAGIWMAYDAADLSLEHGKDSKTRTKLTIL